MNNTNENNKIIAEFLGYEVNYNKCYSPKYNDGTIAPMMFHKSWDWLIPVIEKCYVLDTTTYYRTIHYSMESFDIEKVYIEVVDFIKNQNN